VRRMSWLLFAALLALPGTAAVGPAPRAAPMPLAEAETTGNDDALPTPVEMEKLARTDPLAFLRACIRRYDKDVRGYTTTLEKQEFLSGKLQPVEVVEVAFREEPFSVLMKWTTPPVGRADRALYVEGANDGKTLARPAGRAARFLVGVVARDSDGPDARSAGRYPLPEFGLKKGTERTLAAWTAAKKRGVLKYEFVGLRAIAEAGKKECYVLRRTCDPPEEEGIVSVEVAIDTEHWLQVANVLTAERGRKVGSYYFRDIVLNPEFPPDQFDRAALTKD
jgi:hypothetical protein